MKKEVVIALVVGLVLALGIQTYMMFQLNNKVNELTQQVNPNRDLQAKKPKLIPPALPKSPFDDDMLSNQPWNPYEEMQRMQQEMEQAFNDSFSRFHQNSPLGSYSKMPDLDLQEKTDSYVVTVNIPGADESSLNVKLVERLLQISVKTEHIEESDDDNQYKQRERFRGEFHRALTLPGPVQADKMKNEYRNGVLTITVPKKVSGTPA